MTLIARQLEALRGRVAWITGGRRIGRTVAAALAGLGADLVLSYRFSRDEAEAAAQAAREAGVRAVTVQADASSRESVAAAVEKVAREFPRIDILVNMASVYHETAAEQVTEADWNENVSAHILGTFWPAQLIVPLMPPGGHIINIADATVIDRPQRRTIPYAATKAAVAGMTRAMALEYGPLGIFVNAIAPGPIVPPENFPRDVWQRIREQYPVRYEMTDREAVEQFALLVVYLCLNTMTSGHVYPLDQGRNL